MAGKPRNRMELRRQHEAAEPIDPMEDEADDLTDSADDDEVEVKPKKKPRAPAKKKAPKPAKPAARMRIVWQVLSDSFKPVATFDFAQKEAAETKAAELTAKGKGTHFVQRLKEAMPEDAPGLGASIPREEPVAAKPAKPKAAVEDEELDDATSDSEDEEIEDEDDDDDDSSDD